MDKLPKKPTLNAQWTNDCCGKKDYDASIVEISTRYWPRGGGMLIVTNNPGYPVKIEGGEARPEIKPSATCSLVVCYGDEECADLSRKDFDGETFEEVKAQVEPWAQAQMDRAVAALRREFGTTHPQRNHNSKTP